MKAEHIPSCKIEDPYLMISPFYLNGVWCAIKLYFDDLNQSVDKICILENE